MKKYLILLLIMVLSAVGWAAKVADIDFVNKINVVDSCSLTFARTGIAVNRDGTEVADGVMRTDTVTIATPVEYSTITGKQVIACDKNYIYAKSTTALYRSKLPTGSWQQIGTIAVGIVSAFVTDNGTLLVSSEIASGAAGKVYRWDGTTLTLVVDSDVLTAGCNVKPWGWAEVGGTIFIAEYRSTLTVDNARCIYASNDDGLTWTKIHNPDHVTGKHLHKIVATLVSGVKTVYACYGDSSAWGMTKVVDNGTSTWTASAVTIPYVSLQPTSGVWVPEDDCIVWGTDGGVKPNGLIKQALTGDTFTFVKHLTFNHSSSSYELIYNVFSLKKLGGLYFATGNRVSTDSASVNPYSGVWCSVDAINWNRIISYDSTEMYIGGIDSQDRIYVYNAASSGNTLYFNKPQTYTVAGALIERAGDQRQNAAPTVDAGTTIDAAYTTIKWYGDDSYRWTSDAAIENTTTKMIIGTVIMPDITSGDVVYLAFRVKGSVGDSSGNDKGSYGRITGYITIYDNDNPAGTTDGATLSFYPMPDEWQWIVVPIKSTHTVAVAGRSRAKAWLYIQGAANPADQSIDLKIDGITYEKNITPAEWHIATTDRNADVLSFQPTTFPATFTDIFTFASRFGSYEMGARATGDGIGYIYIRSYAVDNDNFFAVVYDVNDKKFKLIDETATTNTVVATADTETYFNRFQPITIAITRTGTTANLYVWTGGVYQTASGTITDHTITTSYWGCHPAGTQGGSLVFVRDVMYNDVESGVKNLMQWPEELPTTVNSSSGWILRAR